MSTTSFEPRRIGCTSGVGATLSAVEEVTVQRRAAEADLLVLAARWADENPPETIRPEMIRPSAIGMPGAERAVRLGGIGTPEVAEFAPAELGVSMGTHHHAARRLMADALDLRHRLPGLWHLVTVELGLECWVARKIATATRGVTAAQAAEIDARLAEVAGSLPPGRLLTLLDALVIACDTDAEDERRAEERRSRFVHVNQSSRHGTKGLWAKLDAADAIRLDAQVDRVARLLQDNHLGEPSEDAKPTLDECRAEALGLLADPDAVLRLLAGRDPAGSSGSAGSAPRATLFLHLTAADFTRDADGVARFHGAGGDNAAPITLAHAREILGHSRVTIRPVIDLDSVQPADAYEFTGTLREAAFLRTPADCFPYAVNTSRRMQLDHTVPYDRGGPPGQTRLENAGPMTRIHHRIATHGSWQRRQPRSGVFVWATPRGRYRLTNESGTHLVSGGLGDAIFGGSQIGAAFASLVLVS